LAKDKCEKRASNIALSYGVDVDMITRLFYVTMSKIMQHLGVNFGGI